MTVPVDSPLVSVIAQQTLKCADDFASPTQPSFPGKVGPFDQLASPNIPTAVVLVYKKLGSVEPICLTRLQQALELLLNYYPHLTGRLQVDPHNGIVTIDHLGTGATLYVATCSENLDAFGSSQRPLMVVDLPAGGNALLAPFDATTEGVCRDPMFTIQHTRFACGSVSLGVRILHVVTDGYGLFQVVRHLAELYRSLKDTDPKSNKLPSLTIPPHIRGYMSDSVEMTPEEMKDVLDYEPSLLHLSSFQEAKVKLKTEMDTSETPAPETVAENKAIAMQPSAVGCILRFPGPKLAALKQYATAPEGAGQWVSTFDALAAFLYQRIYLARLEFFSQDISLLSPPDFLTPINFRSRLPDMPSMYFPNALLCIYTSLSHDILARDPLWQVAKHIHELLHNAVPDAQHMKHTLRWILAQPDKRRIEMGFRYGTGSLMISQWTKFDMYLGTEFEVRPVLVSLPFTPITTIDGLGYFLPTEAHGQEIGGDKTAIDVNLSLSEPIWNILARDEELSRFTSSLASTLS